MGIIDFNTFSKGGSGGGGGGNVPLTAVTTSITANGDYSITPPEGYSGMTRCNVSVSIQDANSGCMRTLYVNTANTQTYVPINIGGGVRFNRVYSSGDTNVLDSTYFAPSLEYRISGADLNKISSLTVGDGAEYVQINTGTTEITELKEVILPASVKEILPNCFYNCSGLERLEIKEGVRSIGAYAFYGCGLAYNPEFNDEIEEGEDPRRGFILPSTLKYVGPYAFSHMPNLEGDYGASLPDSVTTVGEYAFSDSILGGEFSTGEGLIAIPRYCFYNCGSLVIVYIGSNVKYILPYAFDGCDSLEEISYNGTMSRWENYVEKSANWLGSAPVTVIHCTDGDIEL